LAPAHPGANFDCGTSIYSTNCERPRVSEHAHNKNEAASNDDLAKMAGDDSLDELYTQ